MENLNLPLYNFKIKIEKQNKLIFDTIRKKYVLLTAEEWVRQNFICYLNSEKHYPLALMALEHHQNINLRSRRSDIIIFNEQMKPFMLVECKAPGIQLSNKVFEQAAGYNFIIKANLLIITNGLKHYCCLLNHDKKTWEFLKDIPEYSEAKNL